jgi:hypothetical protein
MELAPKEPLGLAISRYLLIIARVRQKLCKELAGENTALLCAKGHLSRTSY